MPELPRKQITYCRKTSYILCLAALMALMVTSPRTIRAAEHYWTPSVAARTMYDSNIFFDDQSGFEIAATPALLYRFETERSLMDMVGQLDFFEYPDNNEYDRINQKYELKANSILTDYLSIGMNSMAGIDHTFTEQLDQTGEISDMEKRTTLSFKPSANMALNPYLSASTQGVYRSVAYDDPNERDYDIFGGAFALIRELNPKTTGSLNFQYSRSEPEDAMFKQFGFEVGVFDETQDAYQGGVQLQYQRTSNLSFSFGGGLSYLKENYHQRFLQAVGPVVIPVEESFSENDTGYVFDAGMEWQREYYAVNISYSRSIIPGTEGDNRMVDKFNVNLTRHMTEKIQFRSGSFFITSEDFFADSGSDEDEARGHGFFAELSYMLTERSDFRLHYDYQYAEDDEENNLDDDDEEDTRNRVWIEYRYQFAGFPN